MWTRILKQALFYGTIMISVILVRYYRPFRSSEENDPGVQVQKEFRAAVLEHVPEGDYHRDTFQQIINLNIKIFMKAIEMAAKNGAELIMLPEDSLLNTEKYNRSTLVEDIFESMPDPRKGQLINLCFANQDGHGKRPTSGSMLLKIMSCLATKHHIFIGFSFGDKVVCDPNTDSDCPPDGFHLYNTLALFDWNGVLVSKYHKMQLYYEYHYDIPKSDPDPVVYYDSPFGRLGFMICFDLLYKSPGCTSVRDHQVQTILYTTYWFNYLPFVGSVQMQQSFAIEHNVNFIASGAQIPESTLTLGCGIYAGQRGALVYSNRLDGQSKIALATLSTDPKAEHRVHPNAKLLILEPDQPHNRLKTTERPELDTKIYPWASDDSGLHAKIIFNSNQQPTNTDEWCCPRTKFCCRVHYELRALDHPTKSNHDDGEWMALLYGMGMTGGLGQSKYPLYQEFCGLVICKHENCSEFALETKIRFEKIVLFGTFNNDNNVHAVYPSVVTEHLQLLPKEEWIYNRTKPDSAIIMVEQKPRTPVIAVTLYARNYDLDPVYYH